MDKEVIKKILKEELTKTEINNLIKDENGKLLKSKEFDLVVKQITAKVIENFYKILWTKKNFWFDSINK